MQNAELPTDLLSHSSFYIDAMEYPIKSGNKVCVRERPDLGYGEVLRVSEKYGADVADVVFETDDGRRLETPPS